MLLTTTEQTFPKYLMAKSTDSTQSLTNANPFKLAKDINHIITGKLNNVTALSSGFLCYQRSYQMQRSAYVQK